MAHWFRRTVLTAVAVLLALLGGTTPAAAGGPTSVLLSAYAIGKVAAVGYGDATYVDLQKLIQTTDSTDSANLPETAPETGRIVRAAWLIHDQSVYRLDLIYVDATGGPWIATTEATPDGQLAEKPVWHRSTNPVRLKKVLGELGLLGDKQSPAATASPTEAAAAPLTAPTQTVQADTPALTGWRWSIPGFLLGVVIATVAVRLVPRRREWELVDAG